MSDAPRPSPFAMLREQLFRAFERKLRQTSRMSRNGLRFTIFLAGAMGVALFSLVFSWLADTALAWQRALHERHAWAAFALLPPGLAALRWMTLRVAPQARGSGIPQVIATQHLPPFGTAQTTLVSFPQALWKIALTAVALFLGASVGREGPSVQVGAAAMLAWGYWWQHRAGVRVGFHAQALLTAGAAGGLAAAFNTPLAGVVFAIEELGKGATLRWDRLVLAGVLASGFLSLAVVGNNPYFLVHEPILFLREAWPWIMLAALVCGVFGGLFAKLLLVGVAGLLPGPIGQRVQRHPVWTAFGCGVVIACIGAATQGDTYGTGYTQVAALLNGHPIETHWFGVSKLVATVASYFAGIPGGIFTPSLAIGAGLGQHLWQLTSGLADERMLVLISMAAFLAAATQAPITASVIVMEMTRSQDMMFHLLAATLLASFVARQFCPRPFYHAASRGFRREALAVEASSANASRA
ncbi:H(+)/Cl(-) exchange transporter ClcA [Ralstonia condita]|uniref:H(+)/Cl(-) exchange transporter ClcA n=1 Tax=Ralstonia condita TaxID=3058600 RepID=A0ABN9IV50_9RALS|nr:chloride channel protein [Ralstonia sp. LMG 7141]MDE2203681.1 chloride channel protein [Burkholderiaceae bacterium]CAJ0793114.1 H(+)/Cl(-) exchange transporter ClcA [Ralstonia sp. LMG 7141]